MNQKFGDMFAKFLVLFAIWTTIAFLFEIGY
jgi:Na+/H+-dicarboxylate symporter